MTFIVAATSSEWIWMLADRRISFGNGVVKDNARKITCIETKDGKAFLGYAGLGSTALGNEPSDWMAKTIRGLNLPLEQTLSVLAEAAKQKIPRHLKTLPFGGAPSHNIVIPAFVGEHPRIYSIDLAMINKKQDLLSRYTRYVTGKKSSKGDISPRIAIAGSGSQYIYKQKSWSKNLLKVLKAHDEGKITSYEVARQLAKINFDVSKKDRFVSKDCVIIWRHKKNGGGYINYSGLNKDNKSQYKPIPTIINGMDVHAMSEVVFPHLIAVHEHGVEAFPTDTKLNEEFNKLPNHPDDQLR